jgi:predicted  nucleic acid-binding Zn-ribbon protein
MMKRFPIAAGALLTLAACQQAPPTPAEQAVDDADAQADAIDQRASGLKEQADGLEKQAEQLEKQADAVRAQGKAKAAALNSDAVAAANRARLDTANEAAPARITDPPREPAPPAQ